MVWSVLARRATPGAVASVVARTTCSRLPVVARRGLCATPQLNFPEDVDKEKRATSGKRGASPKDPDEGEEKHSKQAKQKKSLKPPKAGPGPFALFLSSFINSQPKATTKEEVREFPKRASEIWRGYSIAEKQPFYDESEARRVQAKQEREEFFRNISLTDLKRLNANRKAQGKPKYHVQQKRPLSAYLLFVSDFRNSPDGQAFVNELASANRARGLLVEAGARWTSMSPEEKAPYFERSKKEKEEFEAEHANS